MNLMETGMILSVLEVAFPQFYCKQDDKMRGQALRLWQSMFADEKSAEVSAAVEAFIATDTSGYPPSIGQIKARLLSLKMPDMLNEAEAWALVSKAIRNSECYAKEEFEKLPAMVQKAVCAPSMLRNWAKVEPQTLQTVVASNFQRSYREQLQKTIDQIAIPAKVQAVLQHAARPLLPDGESLPVKPSLPDFADVDDEEEELWHQTWLKQFEEQKKRWEREQEELN